MKKRLISFMAAMLVAVGTAFGQMVYLDEDLNHNRVEGEDGFGVMVPQEGFGGDQWKYTPLDGGLFLLAGLGAAYLAGKRKKQ